MLKLAQIQSILNTHIWQHKHPRLKKEILLSPVQNGGMGAPNVHAYYKAVILDQLREWWAPTSTKTWTQIETMALTANPQHTLMAALLSLQPHRHFLLTVTAAIRVWSATAKKSMGIPKAILSKIHLQALELISPNLSFRVWIQKGLTNLG